jgi:hypothetical protein
MAAHLWTANRVPVGPQQAEMTVIDQVRPFVMQDRCITVRELAIEVGVSTGSVHSILAEDLGLKSVSVNLIAAS